MLKMRMVYDDEGSIPVGRYWIVDAPKGGVYSQARRQFLDFLHNTNHAEWFGLFNSQTMDDYTLVNGTKRTGFRLHPFIGTTRLADFTYC